MDDNLTQEKLAIQESLAVTQDFFAFSLSAMETIHTRIARLRTEANLSMVELGKRIGVAWQTVQQWENGKTAPHRRRMGEVAEALGVTVAYLVAADDPLKRAVNAHFNSRRTTGSVVSEPSVQDYHRRHQDQSLEIVEVVKLMEKMDDVGRGMVLQETRSIARERAAAGKANSA